MKKGIFCISLDTELLWGRWDGNWQDFTKRAITTKKMVIPALLQLFKKYSFPATWAITGKLLEKGTSGWSYPQLIKLLLATPHQEIACHSYSHPDFSSLSRKDADNELNTCQRLFKAKNITLRSFVFPKNKIAHLPLLRKSNFICYRGTDKSAWELLLPRIPPVYNPVIQKGLIKIPGSMYLVSARGLRKFIPMSFRLLKIKLGIKHAIAKKAIFHIWFHPIDLSDKPDSFLKLIEVVIAYAKNLESKKTLNILPMGKIAKRLL